MTHSQDLLGNLDLQNASKEEYEVIIRKLQEELLAKLREHDEKQTLLKCKEDELRKLEEEIERKRLIFGNREG